MQTAKIIMFKVLEEGGPLRMGQEPRQSDPELPQVSPFKERVRPKALDYCRPCRVISISCEALWSLVDRKW